MYIVVAHRGKKPSEEDMMGGDMDQEFTLDSTPFDVPGWVSVEVGGVSQTEVHINDLYPAVVALYEEYKARNV